MDIGAAMNSSFISGVASESNVIDSEEDDRAFIEISELEGLLGLPPPRFDLGAADIDPLKGLDSAEASANFDTDLDFTVPHKQSLPQRLRMDICPQNESETEVCYDQDMSKVSVIKTELNIGSDGQGLETECNSYPLEHTPVPTPAPSANSQDEMLYKQTSPTRVRGRPWGRGCKSGTLNRVVNKLLARTDESILQNLLLEAQCLQSANSICDNPVPKNPLTIPSPVLNKLKKLGTSVEVEKPEPLLHTINGQVVNSEDAGVKAKSKCDNIPTGYLQIMESLDKAVGLTSDLTKKKKKRAERKTGLNQVPSTLQLLAEVENSDNLTKFSFQVDAKQVIELPEGQKLYTCDICSGVYHRGFSLKRHYLKTHINYKHISKRDLHNCGILFDPSIEKGGARKKQLIKDDAPPVVTNLSPPNDIPDLYRCHSCLKCFMVISDLQAHLMEHPPVSVKNLSEDQFKNYSCPKCKARYQKKKLFLRHKKMCAVDPEPEPTHYCLYCEKAFTTFFLRKQHHLQMHHPKKKLHQCYLCKTKMFKERLGVFKHLILHHPDEYIGCLTCKLRFPNREEYKKHNKENHKSVVNAKKMLMQQELAPANFAEVDKMEVSVEKSEETAVSSTDPNLILKCTECPKMFASHLNMTRHRRLAHRTFKKRRKKVMQKKENVFTEKDSEPRKTPTPPPPTLTPPPPPPPPPPPDPEVLFYSTIAHNIRENLTHHLDGKLDSQEVMEYDLNKATEERSKVLFSASFTPESTPSLQPEATSTPVQQKESRPTPISPRAPWEKFNFPKNYDGRCGLTSYIKDMSHLDIATQLTMRRNLQRLNYTAGQESNKESPANIPAGLLLVEKPVPDCAETFGDPDDSKDKEATETLTLSGEWVRPRNFLCAACGYKSTNLWDVEDHKYALHPNVWVPHIEIVGEQSSPWDWFYHRRLPPETTVVETTPAPPSVPPPCSKCNRQCASLPDLHRHMLDCGGDTTWMATMLAVTSPGSRRRKWRPFGSRRRKQLGRRGLKRNIPNTPAKHSCGRIRTKPGDMDTIQKMIANLPPKRATRRVIGEDPDIKTRSQATIHSVPISSIATHSSAARAAGLKAGKVNKNCPKLNQQKKLKGESEPPENNGLSVKEEIPDEIKVKEEDNSENYLFEAENTIQHSDILTSLQMIPVVRKSPAPIIPEKENVIQEEPIETSKILAAMREAMLICDERIENKFTPKINEKKKRCKIDEKNKKIDLAVEAKTIGNKKEDVIICNGCGMQFDNASACQRHKKKCVYWKEDRSDENNKTNKCSHCGSMFPYLMALLKHNCKKVEISEDPAMPELCPEQPVEEVQGDSVEDIPILSPVEITKDDSLPKKMSLIESTIHEVGSASFDLSVYFKKYFNGTKNSIKSPEQTQKVEIVSVKSEPDDKDIESIKKKSNLLHEKSDMKTIEEVCQITSATTTPVKNSPRASLSVVTKLKSPSSDRVFMNKKVSEIFKEVKRRRGRKRQKIKIKAVPKLLATKSGLRKSSVSSIVANAKKQINTRKRSSNFIMLMKEWEKLQKEGAVAEGKRKRLESSNSGRGILNVRTCRRLNAHDKKVDYVDIEPFLIDDSSSLHEDVFDAVPTRRLMRTGLVGENNDILPSVSKELSRKTSISVDVVKKEKVSTGVESSNCVNVVEEDCPPLVTKEEPTSTQDLLTPKRKPGRPRTKSISLETEQHILETIDSIVKSSMECIKIDECKDGTELIVTKNLGKQLVRSSENQSDKEKTEEHIKQTIEDIIRSGIQDVPQIGDNVEWGKIDEIIYNVSIGSAGVFKKAENDKPISTGSAVVSKEQESEKKNSVSSTPVVNLVRRRRKKRKRLFTRIKLTKAQNRMPDIIRFLHSNVVEQADGSSNEKSVDNADPEWVNDSNDVKSFIDVTDKDIKTECDVSPSLKGSKRKFSKVCKEATGSVNVKPKEIKTKQLSIADYMTVPRFSKMTNGPTAPSQDNDDIVENNMTEKIPNVDVEGNESEKELEISLTNSKAVSETKSVGKPTKVPQAKLSSKMPSPEKELKHNKNSIIETTLNPCSINENPCSPISSSSKEDVALSVIRDKVIQKKKNKLKLKKMLKNKRLEIIENCKVNKVIKNKQSVREEKNYLKERLRKGKRKLRVGVTRNRWEVSVVENRKSPVELLYEEEPRFIQTPGFQSVEPNKKFFCSICDLKFVSSYNLYEHQLTTEHKTKIASPVDQKANPTVTDDNDPVKYCKSIGSLINDLEKRTLNVAKVMHHLKQRDSTDSLPEQSTSVVESTSSPTKEQKVEDNWQQEWPVQQEWSSRSTTPLWEGAGNQQTWEIDNFSTGCGSSIGSIMDTVNKLLSSDQEVVTAPGYSWSDLQLAMGASDEEMAMLEQLGEHSLQEEYVYDNSRPIGDWPPPEDSPTFTDLDHQEQAASVPPTGALPEVKKNEPLSDSEDSKTCRGVIGRPRRMLGDYENKEMVCPTCNKHFLGLPALQTHVVWSHCAPVGVNSKGLMTGLKRRALLNSDEVDRQLVCFVCKEIVSSTSQLEAHIQAQHTKKADEQEPTTKPVLSEAAEKLKTKMSSALGGLVDRALNKLLGTTKPTTEPTTSHSSSQADLNSGALQLLGRLCAARKRVGSENMKLSSEVLQLLGRLRAVNHKEEMPNRAYSTLANEMRHILSRGKPVGVSKGALQASVNNSNTPSHSDIKPTNLLDHLAVCSSDVQERPYACPICDLRFLIPSTRNRHIARAHGKYGRRYDEVEDDSHVPEDLEGGWKEPVESGIEANEDGEMLPLCSDCGLSFQSIHEVMQHRIEDHPRRFSADVQDENKTVAYKKYDVVESSTEVKQSQEGPTKEDVKLLPVSDNAIDSTSTVKKRRGRPPKWLQDTKTGQKRRFSESETKILPVQTVNCSPGKRKKEADESESILESTDFDEEEEDLDSLDNASYEDSYITDTKSPEIDKCCNRLNDNLSNRSSEENLAELSKKLDRRKVRMGNMGEEAVRVKAEAALRELNLSRKSKSSSSGAKWGINAVKFTKQQLGTSSSQVNGSPSKPRFASLNEKKWKTPSASVVELQTPKAELIDVKPDIYDFRDEELDPTKKNFNNIKDSFPPESEDESNKVVKSINWNIKGSPKKTSHNSKSSSNNS